MRALVSAAAEADLNDAFAFLYERSPKAAEDLLGIFDRAVRRLEDFPYQGRRGRIEGVRELPIPRTPYLVLYEVGGEHIQVLRLWHGAREWPPEDLR